MHLEVIKPIFILHIFAYLWVNVYILMVVERCAHITNYIKTNQIILFKMTDDESQNFESLQQINYIIYIYI